MTPSEYIKNNNLENLLPGLEEILKQYHQAALIDALTWIEFDWSNVKTHPTEYGKYLICRKDGKIHWEIWNGSGWAYNGNVIKFWAIIKSPI